MSCKHRKDLEEWAGVLLASYVFQERSHLTESQVEELLQEPFSPEQSACTSLNPFEYHF